jgi:hypothetical protein
MTICLPAETLSLINIVLEGHIEWYSEYNKFLLSSQFLYILHVSAVRGHHQIFIYTLLLHQPHSVFCYSSYIDQSINLSLDYLIRLCPLNPRFYGAQTNTYLHKTTVYSCLHTTKISISSTSIINII